MGGRQLIDDVLFERVAAVDVAKMDGVVWLRQPPSRAGQRQSVVWTVAATMSGVRELAAGLAAAGVQKVSLESTSDYGGSGFTCCRRPGSGHDASLLVMQPGAAAGGENRTFIETARRAQIVAAAIDTIAEVGYAQASFARIAQRLGISRGLISYHFTGKDDLMKQVVRDVVEKGMAYMRPRIVAGETGPGMLRAYIESNLAFMRENRKDLIAIAEIVRSADGRRLFYGDSDVVDAVRALEHLLSGFQTAGQLRPDFDPHVMAIAVRAAIDAVPSRLAPEPEFDIDNYAREIVTVFDLATRIEARQDP